MRDDGSLDEGKRTHVYGPVSWFLEKAMATYSSVLAWRIPGMGKPCGLLSMGLDRVGHN